MHSIHLVYFKYIIYIIYRLFNWVDPVERYGKCTVVGVAHLQTNNIGHNNTSVSEFGSALIRRSHLFDNDGF